MTTPEPVYRPQGIYWDYLRSDAFENLLEGPVRTGKSLGWIYDHFCNALQHSGLRCLWAHRYRASLSETVLQLFEDVLLAKGGWQYIENPNQQRRDRQKYVVRCLNGGTSEIVLAGADKSERYLGGEFDMLGISQVEQLEKHQYVGDQGMLSRLSGQARPRGPRVTADANPQHPEHWVNRYFDGRDGRRRFSCRFQDNPRFWDEKKNDWTEQGRAYRFGVLGNFEGVAKARAVEGKWVAAEGTVYQIDPAVHVVRGDEKPHPNWECRSLWIGQDEGVADPWVSLRAEMDGDKRIWITHEEYERGVRFPEVIRRTREQGGADASIVYDSSAVRLGETLRDNFPDVRPCTKFSGSVLNGIRLVTERLGVQHDGLPRLFVHERCISTLTEFGTYLWKKRTGGDVKDDPEDKNNHAMDALRYIVESVDAAAGPVSVSVGYWGAGEGW